MPRNITPALAVAILTSAIAAPVQSEPAHSRPQSAAGDTVLAQSFPPSNDELRLPERMDKALRDMMQDMKPTLDELLDNLEPALDGMQDYLRSFQGIDDPRHYEMPEMLPNGDIIIRRRDDAPIFAPDPPDDEDPLPIDPTDGIRT